MHSNFYSICSRITPKRLSRIVFLWDVFLISHSHTTSTFHPSFSRRSIFCWSLSIFFKILFFQKFVFDFGILNAGQSVWPCQKQPWTKITVLYFGRTISGVPGYRRSLIRYLNPFEKRNFLTIISGLVFFPWIFAINALRPSEERTSVVTIAKFSCVILDDTISDTNLLEQK